MIMKEKAGKEHLLTLFTSCGERVYLDSWDELDDVLTVERENISVSKWGTDEI